MYRDESILYHFEHFRFSLDINDITSRCILLSAISECVFFIYAVTNCYPSNKKVRDYWHTASLYNLKKKIINFHKLFCMDSARQFRSSACTTSNEILWITVSFCTHCFSQFTHLKHSNIENRITVNKNSALHIC